MYNGIVILYAINFHPHKTTHLEHTLKVRAPAGWSETLKGFWSFTFQLGKFLG